MNSVLVYISEGPDAKESIGFGFDSMMEAKDFVDMVLSYSIGKHININVVKVYREANK